MNLKIIAVLPAFLLILASTSMQASAEIWIDVRSQDEYLQEHVTGAINIPHKEIVGRVSSLVSNKDTDIYLYCGSGRRAGIAKDSLEAAGYTSVKNIGGIKDALTVEQSLK